MKTRFIALAAVAVLLSNIAVFAKPDTVRKTAKQRAASRMVAMLPASDCIAVFDAKRFLGEGLPKILSANQPLLTEIMAKIGEMETRTGINLRKFEQLAVGVTYKQISTKEVDYEPVLLATGADINFAAIVTGTKAVSTGTSRTETIGGKSVFIFTVKPETILKKPAAGTSSQVTDVVDKAMKGLSKEIALVSIDKNTLAIGSVARVREMLVGRSNVSAELTSVLPVKDSALITFAMRPPSGIANLLPLESDSLDRSINAITVISGSMEMLAADTGVHFLIRSKTAADALGVKDMLEVGQAFGKMAFTNKKRPDQQVYARMIDSVKLGLKGTDVTLDLSILQSDIDVLIGGINKK
jgi:hypothetical protein